MFPMRLVAEMLHIILAGRSDLFGSNESIEPLSILAFSDFPWFCYFRFIAFIHAFQSEQQKMPEGGWDAPMIGRRTKAWARVVHLVSNNSDQQPHLLHGRHVIQQIIDMTCRFAEHRLNQDLLGDVN